MTTCNLCHLPIHLVELDDGTKIKTEPQPDPLGVIAARYIKGRRYGLHGRWVGHWITAGNLTGHDEKPYPLHDYECARVRNPRRTTA